MKVKHAKPRVARPAKPIIISPVPAQSGAVQRPISAKRVNRLRISWFVVGTLFGVASSFFMNLLVSAVILPEYAQVMARRAGGEVPIAELNGGTKAALSNSRAHTASVLEKPLNLAAASDETHAEATTETVVTYPLNLTLEVGNGDTLIDMLTEQNVPTAEAHNVVAALKPEFNPRSLRIGQKISLTLARHETLGDAAAVKELAIKLPNLSTVELERQEGGKFNVAAVKEKLVDTATLARGVVKSSLSQAAAEAGINGGAFAEIVQAFSYDVDFQREIHRGDKIEVLFDKKLSTSGQVGGYNNVRYASLTLQGKKHEIYKFNGSWYDAKGNAVKKSLLRTPINAARITSGFGMRRHPILGYSKMHQGVDFGAGTGTPILAAGDGIVKVRGWQGGYGNFVLIQHNGTYSTAYGHMSRFGNIRQGGRVKQGQVIGYVGTTGRSTGPHLHYEVRAHGRQVNPAAKQFNLANGLVGRELANFNARKAAMGKEMAALANPATPQRLAAAH